jgi:hypothetical protein
MPALPLMTRSAVARSRVSSIATTRRRPTAALTEVGVDENVGDRILAIEGQRLRSGGATVPLQATNDVNGNYIIEGEGVPPDIEAENDPTSVLAGRGPQLERGVEEVIKVMAARPTTLPKRPPDSVKTE